MKLKNLISILLMALLCGTTLSANAGKKKKIHMKNCTAFKMYVCSYNSDDKGQSVAHDVKTIQPNETDTVKCKTKRCKVRVAFGGDKPKKALCKGRSVKGGGKMNGDQLFFGQKDGDWIKSGSSCSKFIDDSDDTDSDIPGPREN